MTLVETIPVGSASNTARRAAAFVPASHNDLAALKSVVTELCLNVLQWAEAPGNEFIEKDGYHIIITIQDNGVGIPATMRRVFPDLNDEESVARALTAGVASSGDRWRG